MSRHQRRERFECAYCDERTASPVGSFCSPECRRRSKGERFLRLIRSDHRFCSSCFAILKEIERPTDEIRRQVRGAESSESLVGYEYLTTAAERGAFGFECRCGSVRGRADETATRRREAWLWNLREIAAHVRAEGQTDHGFRLDVFAESLWRTDDWELSAGRAIEAAEGTVDETTPRSK